MSRTAEKRVLSIAKDWRRHHDMAVDAYVRNTSNLAFDLETDGALMYAVDALVQSEARDRKRKRKARR